MPLVSEPPLIPDPDTARRLLQEELSRPAYSTELNPVERAVKWLIETISNLLGFRGGLPSTPLGVIILAIFAIIIVALIWIIIVNPIKSKKTHSSSEIFDGGISSTDHCRSEIRNASSTDNWHECFIWEFRLLVLILDKEGIIAATPGLTAHEATVAAQRALPDNRGQLQWANDTFEMLRYGTGQATQQDAQGMSELVDLASAALSVRQAGDGPRRQRKVSATATNLIATGDSND